MLILAFDCTFGSCSVAVRRDDRVLACRRHPARRRDRDVLMPMIMDTVAASKQPWARFDRLVVTVGPGSFTGVRIAIAACRGLQTARAIDSVGLTSLEGIAAGILDGKKTTAIQRIAVPSGDTHIYTQAFAVDSGKDGFHALDKAACIPRARLKHQHHPGEIILCPQSDADARFHPDAGVFSRLGLFRSPTKIMPLYCRPHYAEKEPS